MLEDLLERGPHRGGRRRAHRRREPRAQGRDRRLLLAPGLRGARRATREPGPATEKNTVPAPAPRVDAPPRRAHDRPRPPPRTILDLADAVSDIEREDVIDLVDERPIDERVVSTQSRDFADILDRFSRSIDATPDELSDPAPVSPRRSHVEPMIDDRPPPLPSEPPEAGDILIDDDDLLAISTDEPNRPRVAHTLRRPARGSAPRSARSRHRRTRRSRPRSQRAAPARGDRPLRDAPVEPGPAAPSHPAGSRRAS